VSDGPQHPAILASDAERATVDRLRHAVVDGRLTLEELSDRVGLAQVARTDHDLARLGSDLPAGRSAAALDDTARHRAFCSRLVRSGPWEIPARSSYRCLFGTIDLDLGQARLAGPEAPPVDGAPVLRITTRDPGGTLYVRNQRPRPSRRAKLLGQGDAGA
jgi:hypothetical protein